jgi:agmatine deiminase
MIMIFHKFIKYFFIMRLDIKHLFTKFLPLLLVVFILGCEVDDPVTPPTLPTPPTIFQDVRVPAEWETHNSTWLQLGSNVLSYPQGQAMMEIIKVIKQYETVNLIANTKAEKDAAIIQFQNEGIDDNNIVWHVYPVEGAFMRDNGPIYVEDLDNSNTLRIQNWKFNSYGDESSDIGWVNDNQIPVKLGAYLGMEVDDYTDYVLEKGNLEVNGNGILVINYDCQKLRNPGYSKSDHELFLKNRLGLTKIIWAYGYYPEDVTTGHIDGIGRFINENTIAIADYNTSIENDLATACENEGLTVKMYPGDPNWLVGNGFVVGMADSDTAQNAILKSLIETYFPGRDVHMIDGTAISNNGGGVHCATNDQPSN